MSESNDGPTAFDEPRYTIPFEIELAHNAALARFEVSRLHNEGYVDLDELEIGQDDLIAPDTYPYSMFGQVGSTKMYMRVSRVKDPLISCFAGLLAFVCVQSPPIAVSVGLAREIWSRVKRLTDEEVELLAIMSRMTNNRPYERWLAIEALQARMPDDQGEIHQRELLASMKGRGILEESAGLWRAVM